MNSGGFAQYFCNRGGDHASATIRALEDIGAHATSGILKSAAGLFGQGGPNPDQATRQRQLEALPGCGEDDFRSMDAAFFEYRDDISNLLAAHLRESATRSVA